MDPETVTECYDIPVPETYMEHSIQWVCLSCQVPLREVENEGVNPVEVICSCGDVYKVTWYFGNWATVKKVNHMYFEEEGETRCEKGAEKR